MKARHVIPLLLAGILAAAAPGQAQWINQPAAGVPAPPKGADGRPSLNAPGPRTADGKPDLSGVWEPVGTKYLRNLAADLKPGDVQMLPAAAALQKEREAGLWARNEPDANCLPQGTPKINFAPVPYKIVQLPGLIVIIYEAFTQWRQIFLDGRSLPADPNPSWFGHSVGKWDGDTLVVESAGFNGKVWLDQAGHPSTDAMRVTERFRRPSFGELDIDVTIDDPKAYAKPWTASTRVQLRPDSELIEFICNENNIDREHMTPPPTR